jgi:hypothetical protein
MSDFRGTVSGTLEASALPWSFGFYMSGAVSEATAASTLNSAVTALWTTATNGLENFIASDVSLTQTAVSTLNSTLHQTTITRTANVVPGTAATDSLPKQSTIVVTTRSAQATKAGHGRFFLPPFAVGTVGVGGVLSSATQTSLQTVFNAFFASLSTGGLTLFIQNRRALKNGTPAGTRNTLITYDIANKFEVHRRRVSKVVPTRIGGNI